MAYKFSQDRSSVIRESDGAFIPFDESNRDYQEFAAWVAEGNQPAEPDIPPANEGAAE